MNRRTSQLSRFFELYPFFLSLAFWGQTLVCGVVLCFAFLWIERVTLQIFPVSEYEEEHSHEHISLHHEDQELIPHDAPEWQIVKSYSQEDLDAFRVNYEQIIDEYRHEIAQKNQELSPKKSVEWIYFPSSKKPFLANLGGVKDLEILIKSEILQKKDVHFLLELYYEPDTSRGRFQPKTNSLQLFNLKSAPENEIVSVFVHELGHYIDLTFLEKKRFYDISDVFYNFSWKGTKVLKPGLVQADFVSGYAMTNKYEDFAETFIYYVMYNSDFVQKAQKSTILQKKYDFFHEEIFPGGEFQGTNFRIPSENVKNYYWDITKIPFSLKNFLEYFQKWI